MASDQESGSEDEYYDPDDLSEVHQSIVDNDINLLRQALESGVNVNEKFTEEISAEHEGMTPLALASALNKTEAVKLLLSYNADVSVTFAALKTTALMTSSFHGHAEIVRLLLKKGADVRSIDLQGSTALGYAFGGTRNMDVISQLLRAGVDVNHKNMLGMNALLLVAGYGDDRMVKMVLDAGADANAVNDFGHSALHLAVVGKRSQLKKITSGQTGQYGLNRRNIDVALKEWTRMHSDLVRNGSNEDELDKVGQFMMSIGIKLDDPDTAIEDDQEAMNRRVEAVYRYRQEKVEETKGKKKGGAVFDSFLSCGGKRSKKVKQSGSQKPPMATLPSQPAGPLPPQVEKEVADLVERCSRVLRLIIDAGCKIDTLEKTFGVTALDMAILLGDVESTAVLMAAGASPNHLMSMFAMSDLYEAIVQVDKKKVKELLTYDSDISANECFTQFNATHRRGDGATDNLNADGLTPIAVAAQMPDADIPEVIKMLVKNGGDINKVGFGGSSPLAEAARVGNLKMVQFLVQQGAQIEVSNPLYKNATPVTVAVQNKHQPVVDFLIQKGAKVDKLTSDNNSALLMASENNDQAMIEKLLGANVNENYGDKRGFMFEMAERFQRPDKDTNAILGMIADERRRFFLASKTVEEEPITTNVIIKKAHHADNELNQYQQNYNKHPRNATEQLDMPIPARGLKPTSEPEVMVVDNGHDRRKKHQHVTKTPPKPPTPQESSDDDDDEDEDDDEEEEQQQQPVRKQAPPQMASKGVPANKQPASARGAPPPSVQSKQPARLPSESEEEESEEGDSEEEEEEEEEEEDNRTKHQAPVPVAKPRPQPPAATQPEQKKQPVNQQSKPAVNQQSAVTKPRPVQPPPPQDDEEESEEETSEEDEESSEGDDDDDVPQQQQKNNKPPFVQPVVQPQPVKPQIPNRPPAVAPKPQVSKPNVPATNGRQQKPMQQQRPPEPESGSEEEEESDEDESEEDLPPPPPPTKQPPSNKVPLPSSKFNQMTPGQAPAKTLTMPAKFTVDDPKSAGHKAPPQVPSRDPTSPAGPPPPLPASRPPASSGDEESGSEEDSYEDGSFEEEDHIAPPSRQPVAQQQQARAPTAVVTKTTVVTKQQVQHYEDDDDDDSEEDDDEDDEDESEDEDDDDDYNAQRGHAVHHQQKRAVHMGGGETDI